MISNNAAWIAMRDRQPVGTAPLLRREFAVDAPFRSATLKICGLGFYEAWINGARVGDHFLDPAQTDYEKRVFYVTHDAAGMVQSGNNCIGVMLGNGWYNQNRVWGENGLPYGQPRLLLSLVISLCDGRTVRINSDESWKCSPGPVTDNNIYAGERYDARLEQPGWNSPDFNAESWQPVITAAAPGGALQEQNLPPVRRIEELEPVAIASLQAGRFVVDMGQNFAGWAKIGVEASAGTEIRLRFAEALGDDGNIDTASTGVFATHVEQVDRYVCRGGGREQWEPRFTYHGFRYVEVDGWPGRLTPQDIKGVVVHTDLEPVGHFECSDDRLNTLHRMALWTHRSNIHSIPEDCPARERCGWLGDAVMVAEFSMWNYQGKAFWQKYIEDIETTRAGNNGIPCNIAPGKRGTGSDGNPDWIAAFIMLPWYLYLYYGDSAVLKKHWPGMSQLMQYYRDRAPDWILKGGFGDWFDPGGETICTNTPPTLSTTLWFYRCATVMRDAASALGRLEEEALYTSWQSQIREAFVNRFYRPDQSSFGSQTANAMALHFGIVDDARQARVLEALMTDIRLHDTHLSTGIMGVRHIFEVLSRSGHGDTALALMRENTYPSFGCLIGRGATTLWEHWGEEKHDRCHGPRSLNHPMMGGFDNWFYNTLAGIQPDPEHPGFKHFFLKPRPTAGLQWVRAHHDCPYGRIESAWTYENHRFDWTITVPPETLATARLPLTGRVQRLSPGTHKLTEQGYQAC